MKIDNKTLRNVFDFCLSNNFGRYSVEMALELISDGVPQEKILLQEKLRPVDESELTELMKSIEEKRNISAISKEIVSITGRPVDSSLIAKVLGNQSRSKHLNNT